MTTHTPEQMRALADEHWMPHEQEVSDALRAAADQLEAVRALADLYERSGRTSTARLIREVTADTAPQEDRDEP